MALERLLIIERLSPPPPGSAGVWWGHRRRYSGNEVVMAINSKVSHLTLTHSIMAQLLDTMRSGTVINDV